MSQARHGACTNPGALVVDAFKRTTDLLADSPESPQPWLDLRSLSKTLTGVAPCFGVLLLPRIPMHKRGTEHCEANKPCESGKNYMGSILIAPTLYYKLTAARKKTFHEKKVRSRQAAASKRTQRSKLPSIAALATREPQLPRRPSWPPTPARSRARSGACCKWCRCGG